MAQIDLGSIKFNWKGSYSGATAYVVDDVVESSGSSYICIAATTGNAPPNATYWEQMSAKGTDGTDADLLSISGTTQGDIYYNNGSAIARLGAGTSGQALITNGTGANPSWGDVSGGKILQVVYGEHSSFASTTSSSFQDVSTNTNVTITPSATSSRILVLAHFNEVYANGGHAGSLQVTENGTSVAKLTQALFMPGYSGEKMDNYNFIFVQSPSTTSAIQYKLQFKSNASGNAVNVCQDGSLATSLTLIEIGA